MAEDKDSGEASINAGKPGATRRSVLVKMMGAAGVSGMLAEEAHAVTAVQKQTFQTAVDAFNSMNTVDIAQSQLWNVYDPNVVIYDVTLDHAKLVGLGPGVPNPLQNVVYGLYNLRGGKINGEWVPNFNPLYYGPPDYSRKDMVRGYARWLDNDGSIDRIYYKFRFNGALLLRLHSTKGSPSSIA
ncbi:MAG: hypothetical protein JO288_10190 [Hyphomicrobiales bacterium]|nr:hypothetical protein [Hyphomicrobiales bacterium]